MAQVTQQEFDIAWRERCDLMWKINNARADIRRMEERYKELDKFCLDAIEAQRASETPQPTVRPAKSAG
jgi:hypothetical protein